MEKDASMCEHVLTMFTVSFCLGSLQNRAKGNTARLSWHEFISINITIAHTYVRNKQTTKCKS